MKQNEYNAAEVVEIGPAQEMVLGEKIDVRDFDSLGVEPMDWRVED
jgi:hypothetical protein